MLSIGWQTLVMSTPLGVLSAPRECAATWQSSSLTCKGVLIQATPAASGHIAIKYDSNNTDVANVLIHSSLQQQQMLPQ